MEDKSEEKEKTEDIQTEIHDLNRSLSRPKNFSLQRRNEIFYFSNESERGILKRVPVKNGTYNIRELETVLEKSGASITRNEIWSDVPLNNPGSSKVNKKSSATKYDDVVSESAYHKRRETVLKSREKNVGYIPKSHGLNNVADLGAYKNNSKTKDEYQDPMTVNNQVRKENVFSKPYKGIKKQQLSVFVETDSKNLQGLVSDEKHKKRSASHKRSSSSKKPEEIESNNTYLNDSWAEKRLSDAFSKMLMKPLTEL